MLKMPALRQDCYYWTTKSKISQVLPRNGVKPRINTWNIHQNESPDHPYSKNLGLHGGEMGCWKCPIYVKIATIKPLNQKFLKF